ncbi:MAG: efflux RND transporter periplasmic adaptor subunit [Pseudomonadales bacterium]|jgi:membrane fusion protein (multidrug efflux system)|nr:efflux RND transporter periplasmic adaptor subunit [Pseudomonadales bacterium]MCP5319358.1 efflux RND transporter periplasmic adaptor subunit [Pseudomonadales bacterium]MCP5336897.1 efflux RND transporter periplasmic adaptor subunit [Pseudomonadales bacterium]
MKKPMVIMVAALVLAFGTLFGFIEGKKRLVERYLANFEPPPVAVSAHPAKREFWDVAIAAVGTLKAVHGVDLASEAAGVVTRMHFRAGDEVAAGDEIASLDDRVEVATLKSLLAQRRLAEINFERDQRLLATKAISRTDFDKTEAQLKDVSAQVERTEAVIARKHLRTPFAGRIGIPLVEVGEYVSEGQEIVTLQSLAMLEVDFKLPEQELPRLAVGQRVRCQVQAYPERVFDGEISAIDAKIDDNTRNVLVRAQVPNPGAALLPGMFVGVEIVVEDDIEQITVEESALSYNLYGDSVFVVAERGRDDGGKDLVVKRTYVKSGQRRHGRIAITEGINEGDVIVTAGTLKLDSGTRVAIDNSVQLGQ